jgi:hypothetical protein
MIIRFGFQKKNNLQQVSSLNYKKCFGLRYKGHQNAHLSGNYLKKRESNTSIQIEPIQEHNIVIRGMLTYVEKIAQGAVPDSEEGFKDKLLLACSNYSEA